MYNLGDHFKTDYTTGLANPKNIIQGKKYRFTLLSNLLIRMEYNENGLFEDRKTELVWNRNSEEVKYTLKEDERYLEVTTKNYKLTYIKEKPFLGSKFSPSSNLRIELLNTDKVWYYNHKEIRNYFTPDRDLINDKSKKLPKGLYSADGFASIDDSKSMIMEESGTFVDRENKQIDTYLFMYLKDFAGCLTDYFKLTGYPSLIPRYALGNWWSRNITYEDRSLKTLVDDFEYHDIPLSIVLLNKSWNVKDTFTFNKELFKSPFEMIEYMHSKGIRLGLNIDPSHGFNSNDEFYDKAKQYLTADKNGVIPFNVMDPKTVDVYLKLFIHPLDNLGIDFFWLDTNLENKKQFLLNHFQFYDMTRNYKRRPMVLTSNSGVASHRYPTLYSGKNIVGWNTLKQIPFHNSLAVNNGVSFWSHDIGGYHKGIEDNELYTRFVQLGTFSPILKFGSDKGKYYKREPWKWSVKTYKIVKDYLTLRHQLIPYIYNEAYKYHKYGKPIIEPVYYRTPEMYDDNIYRNEYYFGSELFVSPIVNKKDYVMNRVIHRFYLPEGVWYDFVTGKKFLGSREYVSFFKDQDYPVFAKAGSIIPLGKNDNLNDTTPPKDMEIQIFPGRSNLYRLYEDDGVSDLYKKGFFLTSSIEYNYLPNNYTVIIRALDGKSGIVPERRNYKIKFRNTREANDVIVYFNNSPIESKKYVDGPDFIVEVNDIKTIGQLTINCKGKDIEIDALRLINEDIESIISDLELETEMKERIDSVVFSELPINKKRIAIRKLRKYNLDRKFIKLFLKLLEYMNQV